MQMCEHEDERVFQKHPKLLETRESEDWERGRGASIESPEWKVLREDYVTKLVTLISTRSKVQ